MTDSTRLKKRPRRNLPQDEPLAPAPEAGGDVEAAAFQAALLAWYGKSARDLPWRAKPGIVPDPYRVWLSEIMLQQTTVKAVQSYYAAFLSRWPTVTALAQAPREEVMSAWAGLGYYSRARNLHACAQILAESGFPATLTGLLKLPGIGAYTAAAIASIAFGEPAAVVDGNVERVVSRLYALDMPLPAAKPAIRKLAAALTPKTRPGDYAQAMMDLGATICTPRSPSCLVCPVRTFCWAAAAGQPGRFPRKLPKLPRPVRTGTAHALFSAGGGAEVILLRRRPDRGLLGGMLEVPSVGWEPVKPPAGLSATAPSPRQRTSALSGASAVPGTAMPPGRYRIPARRTSAVSGERSLGRFRYHGETMPGTASPGSKHNAAGAASGEWRTAATVKHTFTHFDLELEVVWGQTPSEAVTLEPGEEWAVIACLGRYALPAVMKKVIAAAVAARAIFDQGSEASSASSVATVDASARPSTHPGRK